MAPTEKGSGRITGRFGSQVELELNDGTRLRATARRKLQHIVCGDLVDWELSTTNDYAITRIHTRKNDLTRQYFRGTPRTIASNIDRILIVASVMPQPDWSIVDNLLVTATTMDAEAVLLTHKADLGITEENREIIEEYKHLGYLVLESSISDDASVARVAKMLSTGTSIIIGQSGAGKTTLTNKLIPTLKAATQPVSETSGLGQHTTSMSVLYHLPDGGELIDSPGIRDFTPLTLEPYQYQFGFIEIAERRADCRFHNCLHTKEPGCAVKAALENKEISQRRYKAYLSLLEAAQSGEVSK